MLETANDLATSAYVKLKSSLELSKVRPLLVLGVLFLLFGLASDSFAMDIKGEGYKEICSKIVGLVSGDFGSLLCALAGIGAICASAMGGFKMAWTLLVVSIGSFLLNEYLDLFFFKCI